MEHSIQVRFRHLIYIYTSHIYNKPLGHEVKATTLEWK